MRISFPELDKALESRILRKDHKKLGGGFKDLLFPPYLVKISNLTNSFQIRFFSRLILLGEF